MSRVRTAAVLLFLSSLLFQQTFIALDTFPSDEGLPLVAAADVASGKLLYRDCYVPVTPLAYMVQAVVFKIFGAGLLQSRLLMAVTYACCVVGVFAIATICMPLGFAVLAGLASIPLQLWAWPHAQFYSYTPLAVLFSLLAIYLAWSIESRARRFRWAIAFGAALGLTAWAKPNIGLMTGVGVLAYWLTALGRSYCGYPTHRTRSLRDVWLEGVSTLVGVLIVTAPLVAYLAATGTLTGMLDALRALTAIYKDVPPDLFPKPFPIVGQIESLRVNPGLTIPGIFASSLMWDAGYDYVLSNTMWFDVLVRVVYYAPLAAIAIVSATLLARLRHGPWSSEDDAMSLIVLVTLCLYLTIAPHAAVHYLMPAQLPAVILACFLHARSSRLNRAWVRGFARTALAMSWVLFFVLSLLGLGVYLSSPRQAVYTDKGTLWLEPMHAFALQEALTYAHDEIPPDSQVFVFPYYPLFYFLSGLPHATRFIDLRPGSPGIAAEDEVIRRLEEDHVDVVIYFLGSEYPGIEHFESSYPRIYHYIMSHFRLEQTIATYVGAFAEVRRRVGERDSGSGGHVALPPQA